MGYDKNNNLAGLFYARQRFLNPLQNYVKTTPESKYANFKTFLKKLKKAFFLKHKITIAL